MSDRFQVAALLVIVALFATGCFRNTKGSDDANFIGSGLASFYGPGLHGNQTANGERFDQNAMTAAHPKLKFGTCVRVVHAENGKTVNVRINDRGPYVGGRIIDLSAGAARVLGMTDSGVASVRLFRCER